MTNRYGKLFSIFLFALLQCIAPLVHAHPAAEPHGFSGNHAHSGVELYCLDSEKSQCPEARVEALDWRAVGTTSAGPKKAPAPDLAIHFFAASLGLSRLHADFTTATLPGFRIARSPFVSPPAHAPPYAL
ncbi:MAG: hypothetical protein ABIR48_06940 [Gammaproteobacteria bacterium]